MNALLKKLKLSTKNSLLENILVCTAAVFASAFICYDRYYGFMDVIKIIASVLIFIIWIYCAMSSGRNKKHGFLVFAGVYWAAPCLYLTLYPLRDNVHHYSKWLAELNRISDFLFIKPFQFAAESLRYEVYYFVAALIIVTFSFYFIGMNINALYIENVNKGEYYEDDEDDYDTGYDSDDDEEDD